MKKIVALFLTAALCMGLTVPALAEAGNASFTIDFSGEQTETADLTFRGYDFAQDKVVPEIRQVETVEMGIGDTVTLNAASEDIWMTCDMLIWPSDDVGYSDLNSCGSTWGSDSSSLSVPNPKDYAAHLENSGVDVANAKYAVKYTVYAKDTDGESYAAELASYYVILDAAETNAAFTGEGNPETPASGTQFTDVVADAYFADAVNWAVSEGITTGTTATTFSPDSTCTTAQILTFLWRANGSPAPEVSNAAVPAGQYYSDAVNWAYENVLVSGTVFDAAAPCTRSATVTYLWKLAGSPAADSAAFTDVATEAEYAQAVAWAVAEGITTGSTATTFSPDNTCTRGQIVTFLYRAFA